jgi:hypothetical protein
MRRLDTVIAVAIVSAVLSGTSARAQLNADQLRETLKSGMNAQFRDIKVSGGTIEIEMHYKSIWSITQLLNSVMIDYGDFIALVRQKKIDPTFAAVVIKHTAAARDKFGNSSTGVFSSTTWSGSDFKQVNWDRLSDRDVIGLAKSGEIDLTPDVRGEVSEWCAGKGWLNVHSNEWCNLVKRGSRQQR